MGLRMATAKENEFRCYAINTMREAEKRIDAIIKTDKENMKIEYGSVRSVSGNFRKQAYLRKVKESLNQECWQRCNLPAFVVVG